LEQSAVNCILPGPRLRGPYKGSVGEGPGPHVIGPLARRVTMLSNQFHRSHKIIFWETNQST